MPLPQAIVTLNSASGALQIELPGTNGMRRKVELKAGDSIENVLRTCLEGMAQRRYAIGEDGAPTDHQVRHWQRHGTLRVVCATCQQQEGHCLGDAHAFKAQSTYFTADGTVGWADPMCPFCAAEGRFATRDTPRDRRITKADAAALALVARGYHERTSGRWYRQGFETIGVTDSGVVSSLTFGRRWSKAATDELRAEGQAEANRRGYTSPQFRDNTRTQGDGGTIVRKFRPADKAEKLKMERVRAQVREKRINDVAASLTID